MNEAPHQAIDALFLEERRYPPPPELAKEANAQPGIYERDFAEFWASEARERVSWSTPFDQVCPVVPGRSAQRLLQLRRPACGGRPGREGRLLLGRETWARIQQAVQRDADAAGELDWRVQVDTSVVRATSTPPAPATSLPMRL